MAADFAAFIESNGLQKIKSVLLEHDIDSINALRGCTAEDFKEIGLRAGSIGKIRIGLEELMKAKPIGKSQGGQKKTPAAAVKKRPAATQIHVSRQRPVAARQDVSKRRPAAAGGVALPAFYRSNLLPSACLQKVLEYAYKGAVDSIEMNLYDDRDLYGDFDQELERSKVPKELRGRVLDHGRVLLCSGQLPLISRAKGVSKSLGISTEDFQRGSQHEGEGFFLFREKDKYLQARPLYIEDCDEDIRVMWESRRWKTIGTILKVHNPLAALSRDLSRHLHRVAPCNYRYVVNRRTRIEPGYEFGPHAGSVLMIGPCGEALPDSDVTSDSASDIAEDQ